MEKLNFLKKNNAFKAVKMEEENKEDIRKINTKVIFVSEKANNKKKIKLKYYFCLSILSIATIISIIFFIIYYNCRIFKKIIVATTNNEKNKKIINKINDFNANNKNHKID